MEYLNLSHNAFSEIPLGFLKYSHNLIELNLSSNRIESLNLLHLRRLLEINSLLLDNNLLSIEIGDKISSARRMGIFDSIQFSQFKFIEITKDDINWDITDLHSLWDKKFKAKSDQYYIKYYEIVSMGRFDYYEALESNIKIPDTIIDKSILNEGAQFWKIFTEKIRKFGELYRAPSKYDNYLIIYFTNKNRITEFEEFLPTLFKESLIV